jgi:hypothetical protein
MQSLGHKQLKDGEVKYILKGFYNSKGEKLASSSNWDITQYTCNYTVTEDTTITAVFIPNISLIYYANGTVKSDSNSKLGSTGEYKNDTNITKIEIGKDCPAISDSAFSGCTALTELTIPEAVTAIEASAFSNCTGLKNLNIKATNVNMGWHAFLSCTGLETIIIGNVGNPLVSLGSNGSSIFTGCTQDKLTMKVYLTDGKTKFEDYGYKYCSASSPMIESYNNSGNLVDLVIGRKYKEDTSINWTEIPNANLISYMMSAAFYGCSNLSLTSLPQNIKTIENSTFANTNITITEIPDNVIKIGVGSFSGCKGITNLNIPNAVNTSFEWMPFRDCTNITQITFGTKEKPMTKDLPSNVLVGCTNANLKIIVYVNASTIADAQTLMPNYASGWKSGEYTKYTIEWQLLQ